MLNSNNINNYDWQSRTLLLLGEEKLKRLQQASVLIVGLGGVGAYAAEMLCRAGINKLTLVDGDVIEKSNRNRQLLALHSTQGEYKTALMKKRCLDINPFAEIEIVSEFIKDEQIVKLLDDKDYHYVIDAIDTLSPKTFLIIESIKRNIPIVSSMGSGGKLDPSKIQIADISKTYQCPLAAALRKRLRKNGINSGVKTVFSIEKNNVHTIRSEADKISPQNIVGTISYMPAIFGCWCASVCINDLTA